MSRSVSPVIIVTGANGGVGAGICQRLLTQLCMRDPTDSYPLSSSTSQDVPPEDITYEGLTLIMACRNVRRGEAVRASLLKWFEGHVNALERRAPSQGINKEKDIERVRRFKSNCHIEVAELDLASFSSALKFSADIRQRFPYVSHLIFNAGVAGFKGLDWVQVFKQLITSPHTMMTIPEFYTQYVGERSADNVGWIWQSNLFGHFTVFRELESQLLKAPLDGARVIWTSSLTSSPEFYESNDWQLTKTDHSYECVKYQIDLISTALDATARNSSYPKPVRHFVSEPGVCSTNISQALTNALLVKLSVILFYIFRLCGSPYFPIIPLKAAVAACYLSLAPLAFIPSFLRNDPSQPLRFGAQTDRWGHEKVGLSTVHQWTAHKEEAQSLVRKCDKLYKELKEAELAPPQSEVASEKM